MSNEEKMKAVQILVNQAAKSNKSDDALRFSQAACNVANAYTAIGNWDKPKLETNDDLEAKYCEAHSEHYYVSCKQCRYSNQEKS